MKNAALLTSLLALAVLTPAAALAAGTCEQTDAQLSNAQRTAYLKQCLAEASSPANVQRVAELEKKASCEQNAKNKALHGAAKAEYVNTCINKNEAKEAAEEMADNS